MQNKFFLYSILIVVIYLSSCSQPSKPKGTFKSFELINGDTVNEMDGMGKQGRWVPTKENKLKDTVYYRNDTIVIHE